MMLKVNELHLVQLLAIAVLVTVATPSLAQDSPFYVEANIGGASVDDIDGLSIDESMTALRFGTGYRFTPWFGISGSYVDLGSFNAMVDL
jgi:hypothetical protein